MCSKGHLNSHNGPKSLILGILSRKTTKYNYLKRLNIYSMSTIKSMMTEQV